MGNADRPDRQGHPSAPSRGAGRHVGSHRSGDQPVAGAEGASQKGDTPSAGEATGELFGEVGRTLNPKNLALDVGAGAAGLGAAETTRTDTGTGTQQAGAGDESQAEGGGAGANRKNTMSGNGKGGQSAKAGGAKGAAAEAALSKAGLAGAGDLLRGSQSDGSAAGDAKEIGKGTKTGAQIGTKVAGPVGTAVGGVAGGAVQAAKSKTGRRLLVAAVLFQPVCILLVVFALMSMTMGLSSYKSTDERASSEAVRADGVSHEVVAILFESSAVTTVPWEVLAALSTELDNDGLGNQNPTEEQIEHAKQQADDNEPLGPYRLQMVDAHTMAKKLDVDVPPVGDLLGLEYAGEFVATLLSAQLSEESPGLSTQQVDTGAVLTEDDRDGTTGKRRVLNKDDQEDTKAAEQTEKAYVAALAAMPVEGMDESMAQRVFTTARTWALGESVACTASTGGPVTHGAWANPMAGVPSTGSAGDFGPRVHPITGVSKLHDGWDVSAPTGTPIYAAGSGTVQLAEAQHPAWGNQVLINHGGGIVTRYAHIQDGSLKVKTGDQVTAGTRLGSEGATGLATGPHLHFSVYKDGEAVDPKAYLAKRGTQLGTGPVGSGSNGTGGGNADAGTGSPVLDAANPEKNDGGEGSASVSDSFTGQTTEGVTITLGKKQLANAAAIVGKGTQMRVPEKALVVALMTALQESTLKNYANSNVPESLDYPHQAVGSDHDSVGLFQQRPASGWGSVKNLMRPSWSASAFFGGPRGPNKGSPPGLLDHEGWDAMGLGEAAQTVQVSAFPSAYDKWEPVARELVAKVKGTSVTAGCPSAPGGGTTTVSVDASGKAKTAIGFAMDQRGDAYVWGATGPDEWDCSSLVQAAWRKAGVQLPRTTSAQHTYGKKVDRNAASPGDLIFYYTPISHVGIYLGDGKIVHTPRPGKTVEVTDWDSMPITVIRRVD